MKIKILSIIVVAVCLLSCKTQKKEENATGNQPPKTEQDEETTETVQTIQKVDSIVFPIGPKEVVEIYDKMVEDSLYVNHHFADRGMELVATENYEDAVDEVMRDKCYYHEWAYHATIDKKVFPNIIYFESDMEDGFGLSLQSLEDRKQIVITLFSSRAKDLFADLITKEGYVEQFTDSLDEDEHGNKSQYNTVTYFHKKDEALFEPYFSILNINGQRYQVTFEQDVDEPMYEDDF